MSTASVGRTAFVCHKQTGWVKVIIFSKKIFSKIPENAAMKKALLQLLQFVEKFQ